jgi:hypothetical protein
VQSSLFRSVIRGFYKFWWDQTLQQLKLESIESDKIWKAAGRPRHGPIFDKRQNCRLSYRRYYRESEKASVNVYTNALNNALLQKDGPNFWKCWRAKFEAPNSCQQVGGVVDSAEIAKNFADHFAKAYACNNLHRAEVLKLKYLETRPDYSGSPLFVEQLFDVELIGNIIADLSRGKAAGLDSLTAEHLQNSHPILVSVLVKLFNLIILSCHVPKSFGKSYTVPLPKVKDCRTKTMTVDDFRGIAITCVLSKVFELGLYARYKNYLSSCDNQFGFKKGLSCSHAIYSVRMYVDRFVNEGSTVNICGIDLSKAFDKVNIFALFTKLMERNLPLEVLCIIEQWLQNSWTCVKWSSAMSDIFKIDYGVR